MQRNWQAWLRVIGIFLGFILVCITSSLFNELLDFNDPLYIVAGRFIFFFSGYVLLLPFFLMSKTRPTAIFLMTAYAIIAVAYAFTILGIFFVSPIVLGNLYLFYDGHYLQESDLEKGAFLTAHIRTKKRSSPRTRNEKDKLLKEERKKKFAQSIFSRK